MITEDSYSISCYIKNKDGQYQMECAMLSGDEEFYSNYVGDNFVDGLDKITTDMAEQMFAEPEPKPETLEEKIARLEKTIEQLQNENTELNDVIDELTCSCDCKNKNECKESCEKEDSYADQIKHLANYINEYLNDQNNFDWTKQLKTTSVPLPSHWPFKFITKDI